MTNQNADYASVPPRDIKPGDMVRFYVPDHGAWGSDKDCEVKKVSKVKRYGSTKYAITIIEPRVVPTPSTRYVSPHDHLAVRQIDSSGASNA